VPARSQDLIEWFHADEHVADQGDDHDSVLQCVAGGEDPLYQEFVRERAFAGTSEMVIDEIRRWHDAIAFDECCLIFATGREATTPEALGRAATIFATEVMPAFA
jgi:alkanesulfonate monooxygenase SsuD/methylene tetrahydromethanopterin reductase-like flavin-dependent oxidoreductase (luciferase family)